MADTNKSVSGGPFSAGAKATFVNVTTLTVTPPPTAVCTDADASVVGVQDVITLGVSTYSAGVPVWSTDPMGVTMSNSTSNGQAFSCAVVAAKAVFTETAAAIAVGQNFSVAYAKLKIVAVGTSTVTTSVVSATATALTTAAPAVPDRYQRDGRYLDHRAAECERAQAGEHDGDLRRCAQPEPGPRVDLRRLQQEHVRGHRDRRHVEQPGLRYVTAGVVGPPVLVSSGQVMFPTSVIAFAAYIRPQRTGGTPGGSVALRVRASRRCPRRSPCA